MHVYSFTHLTQLALSKNKIQLLFTKRHPTHSNENKRTLSWQTPVHAEEYSNKKGRDIVELMVVQDLGVS